MLNGVTLRTANTALPKLKRTWPPTGVVKKTFAPTQKPSFKNMADMLDKLTPEEVKKNKIYQLIRNNINNTIVKRSEAGGGCN